MNPSMTTSTSANHGSLALIMFFETWKRVEMGLKPKMTCTARSWPSRFKKISDLRTWYNKSKFTKLCLLAVAFLNKIKLKKKREKEKKKRLV